MRWIQKVLLRLQSFFRRDKAESDLSVELDFHLQHLTDENLSSGMSPDEAHYAAMRELGGMEQIREQCREVRYIRLFEQTAQDWRFAFRSFAKNPGFAAVVIVTLALGIGVNTAIFTLVNSILLRPLSFPEPEQLVNASYTGPLPQGAVVGFQQRLKTMELAAYSLGSGFNVSGDGTAVHINGTETTSNLFSLLGVNPLLGRTFRPGDELPGKDRLAILSYGFWQTRFGGSPAVVGRSITVDDIPREIIGVMPADFTFPAASIQLWIPGRVDNKNLWADFRYWMIGRMKRDVSLARARAEFKANAPQVVAAFPWQMGNDYIPMFDIGLWSHDTAGGVRSTLLILLAAVTLILMVACANVANLLLARSSARQREIAIRSALGASRGRVIRQLLTESMLLALAGGVAGVLLAFFGLDLLKSVLPSYTFRLAEVHIDQYVLGFSVLLSLFTGVFFGVMPAFHATRIDVEQSLKAGGQASGQSRNKQRLSSSLVAAEVALAVVLVSGAGLMIKSLFVLTRGETGIQRDHLLTAALTPSSSFCHQNHGCQDFYADVLQQVRALPGVEIAAISDGIPLYYVSRTVLAVEGSSEFTAQKPYNIWEFTVNADYLPAMGITLLRGRNFESGDQAGSTKVVLIEKRLADLFWPGQDPLGKRVTLSWMKDWRTVVGVVQDVRPYNILPDDYAAKIGGGVYFPTSQGFQGFPEDLNLIIRTDGDPAIVAHQLPAVVARVNSTVPVSKIRTMDQIIRLSVAEPRSTMWLFTVFASLALVLGLVGIYSVISYSVSQRGREIGIRMAIGARNWDVVKMILRRGCLLTTLGVFAGLGGALILTQLMSSLLHGVQPIDRWTLIAVALGVEITSAVATFIPARRAARVNPMIALKYE
jgi:putative ABC transport system permease protein